MNSSHDSCLNYNVILNAFCLLRSIQHNVEILNKISDHASERKFNVHNVFCILEDKSMEIYNIYAKKCLSFASNNSLELAQCTYGLSVFFVKTADGKLRGAHSGYQNKCIQYDQRTNSVTTGDCSSNYSISWTCKDRTLKTGDWYLSWNIQTVEIEVVKNASGGEALWVVYETDNSVCDWPARLRSTTTPFVQPTAPITERHTGKFFTRGVLIAEK